MDVTGLELLKGRFWECPQITNEEQKATIAFKCNPNVKK